MMFRAIAQNRKSLSCLGAPLVIQALSISGGGKTPLGADGMQSGYIKLWRKLENSPIFTNSEAVHLFVYLLIKASRTERKTAYKTTVINLLPGQLVTGRKKLSEATGINESKVYRLLELLKSEQQIEQQTNSKYSIITICNWKLYQEDEQQMNSKRTTNEQQMNTIQELKKEPISRFTPPTIEEVTEYCRERNKGVDPEKWMNHYAAKGWKIGSGKMKDWKAAVRTWEQKESPLLQEAVDRNIYARDKDGNKLFKVAI